MRALNRTVTSKTYLSQNDHDSGGGGGWTGFAGKCDYDHMFVTTTFLLANLRLQEEVYYFTAF